MLFGHQCLIQSLLFVIPAYCISGIYDVEEVRSRLYEPDISDILSGIDPSFNLSTVSSENKRSILEKIISDIPSDDDEGYVFVKNKAGQPFACKLPVLETIEKSQPTSYNPKYLAELVTASFYIKNCISKDNGWWKYKLCRGVDVKQWHGAKNEAQQVSNSLGIFLGKYSIAPYESSTQDRLMYLEEHYEGGTLCDLHDKKSARKTAVRYECDPQLSTSEAYIDNVEEVVSCEYVITVKVGSLCSLSAFMPPNLSKPIVCQPFVSKVTVENFLEDLIRKKAMKIDAAKRASEALEYMYRIQRRRASMRRTELLKDPSSQKSALRAHLDKEYQAAVKNFVGLAVESRLGHDAHQNALDSVQMLSREIDDIDKVFYSFDYDSERDQDAGNLWYFFHDNLWNKSHFPKSLNYVDIMNSYFTSASTMLKQLPNTALALRLFPLLRKNPWNPKENLLLHGGVSNTLQLLAQDDLPLFFPTEDGFLNDEMARNIGAGRGLFGFRASLLVKFFIEFVRNQFINGIELVTSEDDIEKAIGTLLAPVYKYIELTLLYGKESLSSDVRRNIEADMTRMLDRLCVAYELAQIRFDLERPNHDLSFAGISARLPNSLFDDYYDAVVKSRTEMTKMEIDHRLRNTMVELLEQYGRQIFHEQWLSTSESLLYKRREQDLRKYSKQSLDQLENPFLHGKVVLNNADVKEVISLLNAAGLKADDVKVEIIATNLMDEASQKFSSEELRVLRELIDRQMDDIRDMSRISRREQAYQTVIEQ
ncbi:hypothetical protein KIN20_023048 [Parelaphostrongylus tenuis]|uniref:MRH domain-containing protein n=1 Tax=Parelaphostrongylus tenuis TaxID=148309 RepID=A0AAD5N9R4_PARTN|nr:hypothetical protein KIN20_023048 [Parelaphostrongylus tenuis]